MPQLGFLKNKLKAERFSIGLDIGTGFIKVVKLKLSRDSAELFASDLEPAQLNLKELLEKFKLRHGIDQVNISLSGQSCVIRYVVMPRMNEAELKQALRFEAQKHIPFPIADVNFDSVILKEGMPDNKILIALAAIKKDALLQRIKLVEDAGLQANIVDLDSLAIINSFVFNYPEECSLEHKAVALINIGSSFTNLNILEAGGLPILSRDIRVAGNNITQKIADAFGLEFKAAEKLKVKPENDSDGKIKACIEAVLSSLAGELRTSFDFYENQSSSVVDRIYISGGSANCLFSKEILEKSVGIKVQEWDPFRKITVGQGQLQAALKGSRGSLCVAAGLALRQ
jgi:type IV pilus assembly protein PilM